VNRALASWVRFVAAVPPTAGSTALRPAAAARQCPASRAGEDELAVLVEGVRDLAVLGSLP